MSTATATAEIIALQECIQANRIGRDDFYKMTTHVSMVQPYGKYSIDRFASEQFWKLYCDYASTFEDKKIYCGIAEQPTENFGPLINDTDLKIEDTNLRSLYSKQDLETLIKIYQKNISKFVKIHDSLPQLTAAFVLERPPRIVENKFIKHGLHIHFPFCQLTTAVRTTILKAVREDVKNIKLFELYGSSDKIIDNVTDKCWLLYGSTKDKSIEPYKLTKIYDASFKERTFTSEFLLNECKYTYMDVDNNRIAVGTEEACWYNLPRLLSISTFNTKIKVAECKPLMTSRLIRTTVEQSQQRQHVYFKHINEESHKKILEKASQLVNLLDSSRADNYEKWMEIGWILFNISQGCEDGLQIWLRFSTRTNQDNFDENVCREQWASMESRGKGFGSLVYLVKKDNPQAYAKWLKTDDDVLFRNCLSGTHHDLARMLWFHCHDCHVSVAGKQKWYKYIAGRWSVDPEGNTLRAKIIDFLYEKFETRKQDILRELDGNDSPEQLQAEMQIINKIKKKLKTTSFKNSIMRECIAEGTGILGTNGFMLPIESMAKMHAIPALLGFSQNVLVQDTPITCVYKGEQPCYDVHLINGQILRATAEHLVINEDDQWLTIKQIRPGTTKLRITLPFPNEPNWNDMHSWTTVYLDVKLSFTSKQKMRQISALCRILGLLQSTSAYRWTEEQKFTIEFASEQDCNYFVYDCNIIEANAEKIKFGNIFVVHVQLDIALHPIHIILLNTKRKLEIPEFLLNPKCDKQFITDYVSGILSGDGNGLQYSLDAISPWQICVYGFGEVEVTLFVEKLTALIMNVFSISARNTQARFGNIYGGATYTATMFLRMDSLSLVNDQIPIRYNLCRWIRLTALSAYQKYYHSDKAPKSKKGQLHTFMTKIKAQQFFYDEFVYEMQGVPCIQMPVERIELASKTTYKVYDIAMNDTHTFVANNIVVHNCEEMFFNGEFLKRLDMNPWTIGFDNGVLDLKELKLRPATPEDFISRSCGYDYIENFPENDESIIQIKDYLKKVFVNPDIRNYTLEHAASILIGININKVFTVLSGVGDNSKSVWIDFLNSVFGEYMVRLPTSLLIGKRTQSSGATPELVRLCRGIRYSIFQETSGKDVFNESVLKELSGNDKFYVRGLFEEGVDITPMFKLSLICNKLPKIDASDPATWNRLRNIVFESKFLADISKVPKTIEEQYQKKIFLRDPLLVEKMSKWRQAFMYMLVKILRKVQLTGWTKAPKEVQESTINYRKNNDEIAMFIEDAIITDNSASISPNELYNGYKEWYRSSHSNCACNMSQNELKQEIVKRWGALVLNHKWIGYRLKDANDEEKLEEEFSKFIIEKNNKNELIV